MRSAAFLLAVGVFAAAIAPPGLAQMGSSGVEGRDQMAHRITGQDFLMQLMRNTAAQIEWSRIAETRTSDPEVKAFAKKIDYQNRVFGYEIYQRGKEVHVEFDPAVSGKFKQISDSLRSMPADQVDIAYLKALQDVGHQTVDLLSGEYNNVIDVQTKGIALEVSNAVAREDSEAHDLLKKRRK